MTMMVSSSSSTLANIGITPRTDPDAPTQREPDWELCPSTARVADDNEGTIWDFAEKASLPMACLRSFNPGLPYDAISLRNQRLCVPLTCETVVVDEIMSIQDFVQNELEDVALFQFLEWNKCLHQSSIILKRDRVCVGPHRGKYTPTLVDIATSTIFTTTALVLLVRLAMAGKLTFPELRIPLLAHLR